MHPAPKSSDARERQRAREREGDQEDRIGDGRDAEGAAAAELAPPPGKEERTRETADPHA